MKVSIVIPIHDMDDGDFFLWRAVNSVMDQTFKDYEIVIVREGRMAENTNAGVKKAKGELIKILYMDDWLSHPEALENIVKAFDIMDGKWLITGADTNPKPYWTDDIHSGNNKLGSPSALTMRKDSILLFDERLSWLLDCDLYKRLKEKYGMPITIQGVEVNIGIHEGQMTNLMSDNYKLSEHEYLNKKYE